MKILILAAGQGERLKEYTMGKHKSLYFLNDKGDSSLSLLLDSLELNNYRDIYIVAGSKFEQIKNFIENRYPISKEGINFSINVIDSRPQWKKGPLYSFLSAKIFLKSSELIALFPADTVFSPKIFEFLTELDFSAYGNEYLHIFYSKIPREKIMKNKNLQKNSVSIKLHDSMEFIESIYDVKKFNRETYQIMVPILILPGKFFNFVEKNFIEDYKKVIDMVKLYLKRNHNIIAHKTPENIEIFVDIDNPSDIAKFMERFMERN